MPIEIPIIFGTYGVLFKIAYNDSAFALREHYGRKDDYKNDSSKQGRDGEAQGTLPWHPCHAHST